MLCCVMTRRTVLIGVLLPFPTPEQLAAVILVKIVRTAGPRYDRSTVRIDISVRDYLNDARDVDQRGGLTERTRHPPKDSVKS